MTLLNRAARRLGRTLADGLSSRAGLQALPGELKGLAGIAWRRLRDRRGALLRPAAMGALRSRLAADGVDAVVADVAALSLDPSQRAAVLTQLSRDGREQVPAVSAALARAAHVLDPQPFRAKWLAFRLWDAGAIDEPDALLAAIDRSGFSPSEARRRAEIATARELKTALPGWDEADAPPYEPLPDALLYVAASALPYHASGYATRTQALARALVETGCQVTVLTRPGYPWDRPDRQGQPQGSETLVEGVRYRHFRHPSRELPFVTFVREAAEIVKAEARRHRVARIHAASNAENALPALVAARELGLPYTFEMRGLWELTRAASVDGYAGSERFELQMALERQCAVHADEVRVISSPVGRQAEAWGVDPSRIRPLPNCVAEVPAAAESPAGSPAGALQLVYAGSVLDYEGLVLLVDAIAELRAEGLDVRLDVAGGGKAMQALEARVREKRLGTAVRLLGRVPPEAVAPLIAGADAVALPRLPLTVCETVPPIKLVEAMALGRPVVVPDLAVFRDEVDDGVEGLCFRAGDVAALSGALRALAVDPALRRRLGDAARERIRRTRTWAASARELLDGAHAGRLRPAPPPSSPMRVTLTRGELAADTVAGMLAMARAGELDALRAAARAGIAGLPPKLAASALLRVARHLGQAREIEAEGVLAQDALALDGGEATLRAYFWSAQRARMFPEALAVVRRIEALYGPHPTEDQQALLAKLQRSPVQQLRVLELLATRPVDPPVPVRGRVAYLLHNSLPYSSGGYGTRSHGIALGLRSAGRDVVALTRPGFPLDIKPELTPADVAAEDVIDGIRYVRTTEPLRTGRTVSEYVAASADALERQLRALRPACVVAASNHLTGLPALIAARRLGLPFCYEVRGLWEITRMSRDAGFEESAAFTMQRHFEARVAGDADHVFTLTEPMREELVARGVDADRVELLPNSCDPDRFLPRPRDAALAARLGIPDDVPVVGYVGTFVDYEGLEDLAMACAMLKARGVRFRLLLVGNENASGTDRGPITQQIVDIAAEAGMQDWLLMPGRVPHDEVESWYSLIDVAPFPRKPWPVCEMVSPMKPLEALAMEKAVLVSDVRALAEMVQDGETGAWFRKGSIESLADVLQRLLADPDARARLGRAGREWVRRERTWASVGRRLADRLDAIVAARGAPSEGPPAAVPADRPAVKLPPWWDSVDPALRARCRYVDVLAHEDAPDVARLRALYVERFGEKAVARRIPAANLTRADLCATFADGDESLLDVGSGLGEFVNLCMLRRPERSLTSVDLKDWDLWFDASGRIERHHASILALDERHARGVVTCFEVVEHLEPRDLAPALAVLRRLARKRLLVSVPFMEPLPLHRGHRTRFDETNLPALFPDATFTVLGKGGRADRVAAWILCEMPGTGIQETRR